MSTTEVILIVTVFLALGFSLYKKYVKKEQGKTGNGQSKYSGSSFTSPAKDDDYEPYSKK
jgi:hypothetical protein